MERESDPGLAARTEDLDPRLGVARIEGDVGLALRVGCRKEGPVVPDLGPGHRGVVGTGDDQARGEARYELDVGEPELIRDASEVVLVAIDRLVAVVRDRPFESALRGIPGLGGSSVVHEAGELRASIERSRFNLIAEIIRVRSRSRGMRAKPEPRGRVDRANYDLLIAPRITAPARTGFPPTTPPYARLVEC